MIRSRLLLRGTEFVVYLAGSNRPVGGPFDSLADAVNYALRQSKPPSRLFYEALDERGRAVGVPMRLRLEPH